MKLSLVIIFAHHLLLKIAMLGAWDGKYICIQCPPNTGILFHNYKGFFSYVLLAICDAKYNFTLVDIGQYGSNNDSGVLANSTMGKRFSNGTMNIPVDTGHKLNVHKMFRKRPGRLLNVLCTFSLRPVSTGTTSVIPWGLLIRPFPLLLIRWRDFPIERAAITLLSWDLDRGTKNILLSFVEGS